MKHFNTRTLSSLALLSALQVVLARFLIPMPDPTMRFSIEAVPILLAGYLFGPISGALVGFVGDMVGTLFSGFGYNPLFAVPPILYGLCAGLLRHLVIQRCGFLRILLTILPAAVFGSMLWQSYWLSFFYGSRTFWGFLSMRAVQFSITSLVNAAVVFGLFKSRVFEALKLWPPKSE